MTVKVNGPAQEPEMPSFAERFLDLADARSPLCLGVDPAVELLRQWGLPIGGCGDKRRR